MHAMKGLRQQYVENFNRVFRSITSDIGREFADFASLDACGTKVFFAHHHLKWERGINERTNHILRKFVPKGMSIHRLTNKQILLFADEINATPRKRLDYRTPENLFEAQLDRIYTASRE